MKKLATLALAIVMFCTLAACSSPEPEVTATPKPTVATPSPKPTSTPAVASSPTPLQYPEYVDEVFKRYEVVSSDYPNLSIGSLEISRSGDSTFYKIPLLEMSPIAATFQEYQNNESKSFAISFTNADDLPVSVQRDVIRCTVEALSDNESDIDAYTQILIDSFNGADYSDILTLGSYQIYMRFNAMTRFNELQAIHVDDINIPVNKENYRTYSPEQFQAPLNQGELATLYGTVLEKSTDFTDIMSVSTDSGVFLIYYDYRHFLEYFEVGRSYNFYGQIAAPQDGFDGCMRIDYAEE